MRLRYILTVFILFSAAYSGVAQQQINFSQYMFNLSTINPGYIGKHEALSVTAVSRWQWAGIEGAPKTQALIFHSPITVPNAGLGFQFVRDEIGVTSNSDIIFGGSYEIKLGSGYLSMGLQGGLQIFSNNLQDAYVLQSSQNDFAEGFTRLVPTVGYGFYYYTHDFYAGISSPFALQNSIEMDGVVQYTQRQHYYGTVGANLRVSPEIKIVPNVLVRAVDGVPITLDYNVYFTYEDILEAGLSYRPPESVSLLFQVRFHSNFRFGYAYDYVINSTLGRVTNSTHEISINYRLKLILEKFH